MKLSPYVYITTLLIMFTACLSVSHAGSKNPESDIFIHRSHQDTVNWLSSEGVKPDLQETDREWPAERLGITGPIVFSGGTGVNSYLLVYDPAGILVGKIDKKEAAKNPDKLNKLMDLAYRRARIQNRWSLKMMQEEAAKNMDIIQEIP